MQTPANLNSTRKGTVVQCRAGYEADGNVISVYGIPGSTSEAIPVEPAGGSRQRPTAS